MELLTYSTRPVPSSLKVSYWNGVFRDRYTPMEICPDDPEHFEAEMSSAPLGRFRITSTQSCASRIIQSQAQPADHSQRVFYLYRQVRGRLRFSQCGRVAELDEGDMALCDSALPFSQEHDGDCQAIVLAMPREDLLRHLPAPEQIVGEHLGGRHGLQQAASVMIASLWDRAQMSLDPEMDSRLVETLLELLSVTWTAEKGRRASPPTPHEARRNQIKRHIETHLRDSSLSASTVALAFGISARYLHMLFAGDGETISSYILRRRLEQCAKQLSDPALRHQTITDIAFSWGFNNATHFARVFRDRYDATPREYRNRGTAALPARMLLS